MGLNWINDRTILLGFSKNDLSPNLKPLEHFDCELLEQNAMRLIWETGLDQLKIRANEKENPLTKCGVLQKNTRKF